MEEERRFHWADYVVFCASLAISAAIGIYFAIKSRRRENTAEYLMGGRDMGVLPVAASLVVSLLSAIFVQSVPVETYGYGMYYAFEAIGYAMAIVVSCIFYHPVYHHLGLTSIYEYLELRYCKGVRIVCSFFAMLQMALYSSVALYAPCIAISQATGLPIWGCIIIFAVFCTFYTTLGGFKTVLWTDTLQCGIMLIGLAATLIKACIDLGGISRALAIASEGQRTSFTKIVPNPLERHTIWNWLIGDFPFFMSMYATGQFAVQRFCSVKTLNKARLAMLGAIPIEAILMVLVTILGVVAYAYYQGCDPYASGRIRSRDQTLALLVMDVFQNHPGMAGVFLSSVLSAALSSLSSVQNSLALILLEDFLKPMKLKITKKPMTEKQATIIAKVTVLLIGMFMMCLSILASRTGKLVLQLSTSAQTLGGAPVLGIFTMGLFMPFANSKGAVAGLISGIAMLGWVVFGNLSTPKTLHPTLPVSTHLCSLQNITAVYAVHKASEMTTLLNNATDLAMHPTTAATAVAGIRKLYQVSYKWYTLIGIIPTITFGVVVSLLTGGWATRGLVRKELMFSCRMHSLDCCRNTSETTSATQNDGRSQPEAEMMLNEHPPTDKQTLS